MNESIVPFIHRKVVVLNEGANAVEAARAMCANGVGSVVVSDGEGHMVGIVTDRDLTCAIVAESFTPDIELSEVMTASIATVPEDASLMDVIRLMKDHGIRRVPVVQKLKSGAQRCVGLISLDDLVAARAITIDDVSQIVRSQIYRRQNALPEPHRREAPSDPQSHRFFSELEEKAHLSEPAAHAFAAAVFGNVVRRLHFTSAAHLISHVPARLRSELLDLPAGPDHSIDADRLITDAMSRFDLDREAALEKIHALWTALSDTVPAFEVGHIASELPDDFRALFAELPKGKGGFQTSASMTSSSET